MISLCYHLKGVDGMSDVVIFISYRRERVGPSSLYILSPSLITVTISALPLHCHCTITVSSLVIGDARALKQKLEQHGYRAFMDVSVPSFPHPPHLHTSPSPHRTSLSHLFISSP